jgi:hypothetical protein
MAIWCKDKYMVMTLEKQKICTRCGDTYDGDRATCPKCRRKSRQERILRYNSRLLQGLCPECGGPRDLEGFQCSKCRAKMNIAQSKIAPPRKNKYQADYLKHNRSQGLCPSCGSRRDDPTRVYCSKCRARARKRYYKNGGKARVILNGWATQRPLKPLCSVCGFHHRRCEFCGKMMNAKHGLDQCIWTCKCGNSIVVDEFCIRRANG